LQAALGKSDAKALGSFCHDGPRRGGGGFTCEWP
jgi:hypothetical protein